MNRNLKFLFVLFIFITMLVPLISGVFGVDAISTNTPSTVSVPNLVKDDKLNMKFPLQFDDYYSQNFPFRSLYVSLYHKVSTLVFNETSNEKVILGKEEMLYFNETLDDYQRLNTLSDQDIMRLNEVFRLLDNSLSTSPTSLHVMIAPNKSTIYPEYMDDKYIVFEQTSNLEKVQSMITSIGIIDVKSVLLEYKDVYSELLYHKKDSHWNNLGAYIAYVETMKQIKEDYLPFDLFDLTSTNDWKGDLSTMLFPAFENGDTQYDLHLPETFTFTRPIRQLDDVQIESINAQGKNSLMMFRDSFANALIPYLSQSFNQSVYYRNFPYDFTNLNESETNHIILEIAERNIPWLLQATPVLVSVPTNRTMRTDRKVDMEYEATVTNVSDQIFINAHFKDQEVASAISAVKLVYNDVELDAFPIYQDSDYQDDKITVGFSAYVDLIFDKEQYSVYVLMDGLWYYLSK